MSEFESDTEIQTDATASAVRLSHSGVMSSAGERYPKHFLELKYNFRMLSMITECWNRPESVGYSQRRIEKKYLQNLTFQRSDSLET